ncbi:ribonucleoside triphosphate reductase [Candidatus Poribacteria bacterium]|nr:ribonucleoside triphosphate reductase [Candidatus Poribacteria bacterium]
MAVEKIIKRDGRVVNFDISRIANAIFKAARAVGGEDYDLACHLARQVVSILEEKLKPGEIPTVEQVQDVVEKVLVENGHYKTAKAYILYRRQHEEIRKVRELFSNIELIDNYIDRADWRVRENSNMTYSLQGLNFHVSSVIASQYWLERIYPPEIREAHLSGDLHIHDLGILGPYTYYGHEVVVAKIHGEVKLLSFKQLYDMIPKPPLPLNEADRAYVKYPKDDLYVLDKGGWTKVLRVVSKRKDRSMRFIKNRGGRSVIVTDNHPMITERGEKRALDVGYNDKLFTVDLTRLLSHEDLFSIKTLDLLSLIREHNWEGDKVYFNGVPIEEIDEDTSQDGILHTLTFSAPRYINLTEKFGYFVGFAIAEGFLSYDVGSSERITISQVEREPLLRANQGLLENRIFGCITKRNDGRYELCVKNPFLRFLFDRIFLIQPKSRYKTLPADILRYALPFVKGVIGGLIDGDGSINTCNTTLSVRTSSRTLLEQMSVVMELLGFVPRDRAVEGQGNTRIYKGGEIIQRYPLYGVSFRKIDVDLPSEKYRKAGLSMKAWHDEDKDEWHKVINNDPVEIPDDMIYDITTESGTLVVNGMWNHNCVGWDLRDLLLSGFKGVRGKISSSPPKHFRSALGQLVNFLYTLQGEAAGAQAVSNLDTLLAPFIRIDKLDYKAVKQALQEFIFNLNVPTRVGFQTPFSNCTLDLKVPDFMRGEPVVVGGKVLDTTYGEFQEEVDIFNEAFAEVMLEGDADKRAFTFPIPTYNITPDFDWENPRHEKIWRMTAKYGIPYFSNFISSDMSPEDVRSMCCRLRIDNRELRRRGGGLFGANPLTGSIGVVTINMPRLGYLSRNEEEFFSRLDQLMYLAKESLEIKREVLENLTEKGLYPYSRFYLRGIRSAFGQYWKNHFSTIGLVGMNECCLNLFGRDIGTEVGWKFAIKVLDHMRERLSQFQEETGNIYNLEATPAEGASYRLARIDKKRFPDIIVANEEMVSKGAEPYYTNSSQLPVEYTGDLFEALRLQEPLQTRYTGGTVFHIFIGEKLPPPESIGRLVRKICENFSIPYFTITPTFSICPIHGYIFGEHQLCPKCLEDGRKTECEVYSRIVGYLRPVDQWNDGKQAEFKMRRYFKLR